MAVEKLFVRVGDFRHDQREDSEQDQAVVNVHTHQEYKPGIRANDLALLLLKYDLRFDDYTQPACLPAPSLGFKELEYFPCVVSGWGTTDNTRTPISEVKISNVLRWVEIPLVSDSYCASPEVYIKSILSR